MQTPPVESSKQTPLTVVGLGELIWDMLPGGKQLGGAPSNFAYISRLLGDSAVVASRIGADDLGREARVRLERLGLSTAYLQLDDVHPTGTVIVEVDGSGEPHFAVNENSAWDYLEWTPSWEELALKADAVCFGTLGQRDSHARETILRFLRRTRADALRVFDVNLRHSFFTVGMLNASLQLASIVKLNQAELATAAGMLGLKERDDINVARHLSEMFALKLVAVTRGARGSLLIAGESVVEHRGLAVQVVDMIGAGDAFTAALAHFYMRRAPLKLISEVANRVGAWIATQAGATPETHPQTIEKLLALPPAVKI
jgi:fructokinase